MIDHPRTYDVGLDACGVIPPEVFIRIRSSYTRTPNSCINIELTLLFSVLSVLTTTISGIRREVFIAQRQYLWLKTDLFRNGTAKLDCQLGVLF